MSQTIPQIALNGVYLYLNCNPEQNQLSTRFHSNIGAPSYNFTWQNTHYTIDNAEYRDNRPINYSFHDRQPRRYHSTNNLHQHYATSMRNNYDSSSSPSFSHSFSSSPFYQDQINNNQERYVNQYHRHYHHFYNCPPYNAFDSLGNQYGEKTIEPSSEPSCSTDFYDKPHQNSSNISGTRSVQEERFGGLDNIQTQGIEAYYQQLQYELSERVDNMGYDLDSSQEKEEMEKGKKKMWVHSFIKKIMNRIKN